jgi:hypothetical protein
MLARLDHALFPRSMESVNRLRIKNESIISPTDSTPKFRINLVGPKAKINRMRKENTYTLKLESHLIPFINPDDAEMVYTRIMAVMTRISMTLLLGMPVILEMPPATEKAPVDREPAIPAQRMKMHRASMASESLPLIAFSPTSG